MSGSRKEEVGPSLASRGFATGRAHDWDFPAGTPSIEGIENIAFNSFTMGLPITNLRQANNTWGLNDNFSKVLNDHIISESRFPGDL